MVVVGCRHRYGVCLFGLTFAVQSGMLRRNVGISLLCHTINAFSLQQINITFSYQNVQNRVEQGPVYELCPPQ
jgi:hypothetical protein